MHEYDLEHKLQFGSAIYIDDIPTYKITMAEMSDLGFYTMQRLIFMLCMDDDAAKDLLSDQIENPSTFIYIYASIIKEYNELSSGTLEEFEQFYSLVPKFLSLLFRKKTIFHESHGFVVGDFDYIIDHTNYDRVRNIIKLRNCLMDVNKIEEFDNPDNEMARKLLDRRKKTREMLKKRKNQNEADSDITMADLISIFAESSNMFLHEIYENYDIYQFNNQFNRMKIMSDFDLNIQVLLAGGSSQNELQHWLTKINKQDD